MCRRIECSACGRPTFAGCGAHVEQVLRDVPAAERCQCRQSEAVPSSPRRSWWPWGRGAGDGGSERSS